MEPQFRFCTSADGTRISYAIYGSGPPLLYCRTLMLGMHESFLMPEARALLDALAARTTLVTFDRRGTGASTRTIADQSANAEASDVQAVADAVGCDRFTLFADGSAVVPCALYATEYHRRIERLVLWSTAAGSMDVFREMARLIRQDWSYARRVILGDLFPDGPVSLQRQYSKGVKDSISPEVAARSFERLAEDDFEALLSAVSVPALVLSRQEIAAMRPNAVRVAGLLANSQLRLVTGNAVAPFPEHEPIVDAIFEFMGLGESPTQHGRLTTVLFTDVVGHTEMMQRLGDEKGREVLREHERITREVLKANGGTEVKTMGDGFMASFGSVTRAVECAIALQKAFDLHNTGVGARRPFDQDDIPAGQGDTKPQSHSAQMDASPLRGPGEQLSIRCGLNAGEPIEDEGDLFGSTVILASRIAAAAGGGEILASDVVRGLCSGKPFTFADRGEQALKGFEEPVRVWEVSWQ